MINNNSKKSIIFLLILFISIGFAYLSTSLSIGTLVGYSANSWDIYFDDIKEDIYKTDIVTPTIINNKTTINFSISLNQPLSTYVMVANVVNGGTIDAMLDSWNIDYELTEAEEKVIDIKFSYADGTPLTRYDYLKAKSIDIIKVTAIYKDNIENSDLLENSGNLDFSVTLNYIQAKDDLINLKEFKNVQIIKNLNTEGVGISTTDHYNELRFIGSNPNNYVSFNNEKWRIIGLFDGQLKIIRDSIGTYSYDTSHYDVNNGWGVNQWGESTYENGNNYSGADLMKLLNPGYEDNTDKLCNASISTRSSDDTRLCGTGADTDYTTGLVNNSLYWNAASGVCYSDGDYAKKNCDFTSTGLKDATSIKMIDDYTWKLGSLDVPSINIWDGRVKANLLYQWERSSNNGKQCASDNKYCSDTINRTIEWKGKVGLMYPSDWVYATGGGTEGRLNCLSYTSGYVSDSNNKNWSNTYTTCYTDNWLYNSSSLQWTMTPRAHSDRARIVFNVYPSVNIFDTSATTATIVRPVVYLKNNIILDSGNGNINTPFTLKYS